MTPNGGEAWRIQKLEEASERHDRDLYRGNGLPGITSRVKTLEDGMEDIRGYLKELRTQRDTKMNLVLGGIITLIAGWALAHFRII